jgi:hypothetical protein
MIEKMSDEVIYKFKENLIDKSKEDSQLSKTRLMLIFIGLGAFMDLV